jgi:Uma2 family endonuclease
MTTAFSRVEVAERLTSADFLRYAPETEKAELIDGVMIVAPPPLDEHEKLQIFLLRLLGKYAELFDLGEVRGSRTTVVLADDQIYEPDLLFVARERLSLIEKRAVFGPPDLVVEILSASTAAYDRGAKYYVYEQAGVREVWLIDPYGPAGTEFYQCQINRLQPVMPDANNLIHSIALPGLKLNTTWLWPAGRFITINKALPEMGVEWPQI